ncbi:odorant receptor 9a-like [Prorops nasuta]|uniref:odorant receptor 9a-like n=1 Tax=Prorops nasuta TaxID=863751 RepID=UPI0034CF4B72
MDLFNNSYYKFNKILLSGLGVWPYQLEKTNMTILCIIGFLSGTHFLAKILGLIAHKSDPNILFVVLPPIMVDILSFIKISFFCFRFKMMKALLDRIKADWSFIDNSTTTVLYHLTYIVVIKKNTSSLLSLSRTSIYVPGVLFSGMTCFLALPILTYYTRSNRTAQDQIPLLHVVEYYVDVDRFYYPIVLHGYFIIILCITIIVAVDSTFVVFVSHICGIFSVLGYRLEHLTDRRAKSNTNVELFPRLNTDKAYKVATSCMQLHISALNYANLLEMFYATSFFLQVGLNVVLISFSGVTAVLNLDNTQEFVRQLFFCAGQFVHIYFKSFQAQRVIDYSSIIHENIGKSEWYRVSLRTRRLLQFMMMRSRISCRMTAGKIFILSMESFTKIIRTSASYFTMLLSTRR